MHRTWLFVTLILVALLMGTAFCHLLEMPQKLNAPGPRWLGLQQTLYPEFAYIGGPIELAAVFFTAGYAWLVRRDRAAFRLAAIAAILVAAAFFGLWLGLINPVNARTAIWTATTMPPDWPRWRTQWEYAHAARFVMQFSAFGTLLRTGLGR